ncbi:MAG: hypothetical protein ACRC28_00470 [Clostridium sp.]|uniref:hypothetical protein n=1 Tax=Clostridium sp. TaxID=1506 RepID=UPI003F2F47B6
MPIIINTTKSSNKSFVDFGDVIKYTITILNSGDTTISNVYLIDTLPTQVTFTTNSVFINNAQALGFNPPIPMTLPNLLPNEVTTVSFECGVNTTFPVPSNFSNTSNLIYSYTTTATTFRQSDLSNQSSIFLNKAILGVNKYTDDFSGLNYPLPTTIVIDNFGNTLATNLSLTEILDSGMSIDLSSLKEDNVSISGDPTVGISLGNLAVNNTKTIFYNLLVTSLPASGFVETYNNLAYAYKVDPSSTLNSTALTGSYYELTTISSASLTSNYSVNPTTAFIGTTVTYTLSLSNVGNLLSQLTTMTTTLPSEISFVPGSVYINNINVPLANPSTISIPNLNPNDVATVSFIVLVNTLPSPNPLLTSAVINYKSAIPNSAILNTLTTITNITSLTVNSNSILFNKFSDKFFYTTRDTITYTLVIQNQGSVNLINCILYDTLPVNLQFIPNSVQINNIPSIDNPLSGITLNTISSNSTITVTFNALILS